MEITFECSTWFNDSTWHFALFNGIQKIQVNTTPPLLGVIPDRSLTFNAHLKKLTKPLSSSLCIIKVTAHASRGWHHSTLKMAFHTLISSKIDYVVSAWQLWLSATNISCLDCLLNHFLWLITSQLVSLPLETLFGSSFPEHLVNPKNLEQRYCPAPMTTLNVLL